MEASLVLRDHTDDFVEIFENGVALMFRYTDDASDKARVVEKGLRMSAIAWWAAVSISYLPSSHRMGADKGVNCSDRFASDWISSPSAASSLLLCAVDCR